jgi:hypothetical protein
MNEAYSVSTPAGSPSEHGQVSPQFQHIDVFLSIHVFKSAFHDCFPSPTPRGNRETRIHPRFPVSSWQDGDIRAFVHHGVCNAANEYLLLIYSARWDDGSDRLRQFTEASKRSVPVSFQAGTSTLDIQRAKNRADTFGLQQMGEDKCRHLHRLGVSNHRVPMVKQVNLIS